MRTSPRFSSLVPALLAPLAVLAVACGDDSVTGGSGGSGGGSGGTGGEGTGGIPVVASSSSGMIEPTLIGQPCTSDSECDGGICISEANSGQPGGFCTLQCEDDSECEGEVCFVGAGVCLADCGSDACRAGYACEDLAALDGVSGGSGCLGACTDDSECTIATSQCITDEESDQFGLCISPELCDDDADNDIDNLPDCLDSDCATDAGCVAAIGAACTGAAAIVSPQMGDNTAADNLFLGSCGGLGNEDLYTFTFPARGQLHLEADGGDIVLYARADCDDPATDGDCSDGPMGDEIEIIDVGAESGEVWTVFVDSWQPGTEAAYTLTATFTPAVCGDSTVTLPETCDDGNAVDDDGCSALCEVELDFYCNSAIVATLGSVMGDTTTGTNLFDAPADMADCTFAAGTNGNEIIYVYTPATTGMLTIDLESTGDTDLGVYARTDCLDTGTQVGCADVNFMAGMQDETLTIPVTMAVPVTIFVDAFAGPGGTYTMTLSQP